MWNMYTPCRNLSHNTLLRLARPAAVILDWLNQRKFRIDCPRDIGGFKTSENVSTFSIDTALENPGCPCESISIFYWTEYLVDFTQKNIITLRFSKPREGETYDPEEVNRLMAESYSWSSATDNEIFRFCRHCARKNQEISGAAS